MQLPDKPFAAGRTAKLYAWKPGWALKVYDDIPWPTKRLCELECQNTQAISEAGIPAPKAGEILFIEGRWALELQRIAGHTLADQLSRQPWMVIRSGRLMAELHHQMHNTLVDLDLPSQYDRLVNKLQRARGLPSALRDRVTDVLNQLPRGESICHGDFHVQNIMISAQGPIIIDWLDTTRGHPLSDVARTLMIMRSIPQITDLRLSRMERLALGIVTNSYFRRYLKHYTGDTNTLPAWMAVNCAARMSEEIPGQEEWLISQIEAHLNQWHRCA